MEECADQKPLFRKIAYILGNGDAGWATAEWAYWFFGWFLDPYVHAYEKLRRHLLSEELFDQLIIDDGFWTQSELENYEQPA
jgi:hypothetical protein